jgi:hypothetical protein
MMSTGFGFCPTCGTPRTAAEQKFCAVCGSSFAAVAPSAPPAALSYPPPYPGAPPAAPFAPAATSAASASDPMVERWTRR